MFTNRTVGKIVDLLEAASQKVPLENRAEVGANLEALLPDLDNATMVADFIAIMSKGRSDPTDDKSTAEAQEVKEISGRLRRLADEFVGPNAVVAG